MHNAQEPLLLRYLSPQICDRMLSDDDSSSVGSDIYEADDQAVAQWFAARRVALAGEQSAALVQRVLD